MLAVVKLELEDKTKLMPGGDSESLEKLMFDLDWS